MAKRVIVASFSSQDAAFEAAQEMQALEQEGVIGIRRGAIVTKDMKGNLSIPVSRQVGHAWGLLGGGVIGGLLGLLLGAATAVGGAVIGASAGGVSRAMVDVADYGLGDDFLRKVGTRIEPGQTVVLAELEEDETERVDNAVTSRGGQLFRGESGDANNSHGDSSGTDTTIEGISSSGPSTNLARSGLQTEQAQESAVGSLRGTPGEANPALAETKGYMEGTVSTADLLRARGSAEALLPGALQDRDKGLAGRPPFHGSPAPPRIRQPFRGSPALPVGGVRSEEDLYDEEENHTMHEEPGMHVFAPDMLNIPSEERGGENS